MKFIAFTSGRFAGKAKMARGQMPMNSADGVSPFEAFTAPISRMHDQSLEFLEKVKSIGFTHSMEDYDRRKLSIFNQLNFFQLITGIIIPVFSLFLQDRFSTTFFFISCLPAAVSFLVLFLNFYYKHDAGLILYFILYPLSTSIVYLHGMNLGLELSFILYGILSVFFLQRISQMLFAVSLSMVSYIVLAIVCKDYNYQLRSANELLYLFNQLTAIVLIFYGLFLIKKENAGYQHGILANNMALKEKTLKIQWQKHEIEEKAILLKNQTTELAELNSLKTKLFSIISHDLRAPMYALRNLFQHIQQQRLPAAEIRKMLPDIVDNLHYTTCLMENLLLWSKTQMQSSSTRREEAVLAEMFCETIALLRLQAESKKISINCNISPDHIAWADKDMIGLVVRNLLSNALKFTPPKGTISIKSTMNQDVVETTIIDSGSGIDILAMEKIQQGSFYTTMGTAGEQGTGLGLILCKEFIEKNGGQLKISSHLGKGTSISFTLPCAAPLH